MGFSVINVKGKKTLSSFLLFGGCIGTLVPSLWTTWFPVMDNRWSVRSQENKIAFSRFQHLHQVSAPPMDHQRDRKQMVNKATAPQIISRNNTFLINILYYKFGCVCRGKELHVVHNDPNFCLSGLWAPIEKTGWQMCALVLKWLQFLYQWTTLLMF